MSTKFIFDVDGVLCDRGQKINDRFRGWLEDFLKDKEYYLLTGSPREKTKNQIGMVLTFGPKIGYYCLGNSIWTQNGFEVVLNRLSFSEDELKHLKSFYDQVVDYEKQTGKPMPDALVKALYPGQMANNTRDMTNAQAEMQQKGMPISYPTSSRKGKEIKRMVVPFYTGKMGY